MQPKVQTQTPHLQSLRATLICRNYEFLDDSLENSVHTSVLKSGINPKSGFQYPRVYRDLRKIWLWLGFHLVLGYPKTQENITPSPMTRSVR